MASESIFLSASTLISELYSIVWLNAKVVSSADLGLIIPLCTFERASDCLDYIRSGSNWKRIIIIIDECKAQDIVCSVYDLPRVFQIYVRCTDGGNKEQYKFYLKVRCVGPKLSDLILAIQAYQNRQERLMLPLVIKEEATDSANRDSLTKLTSPVSNTICDGSKDGHPAVKRKPLTRENILAQYARDSSFWHMLNTTCCNSNPSDRSDRLVLREMYEALREAQITESICVYRGELMQKQKLEDLHNSVNRRIVINSFLSTTFDRTVALMFVGTQTSVNDMVSVLYEIEGTYQQNMRPFADISQLSLFPGESEILFMAGSVFRINEVREDPNGIFIIRMTVSGDNEDELHDLNN